MKQEFYGVDAKIWLKLVLAASVSSVLVLPYLFEIRGQTIPPLSEFMVIAILAFVQYGLMFLVFTYLGLRISKKIEIEATPVLSGKTKLKKHLKLSIASGVAVGLALLSLDFLFSPQIGAIEVTVGTIESILASFYGGIAEEILMRLFVLPFICLLIIGSLKLLGFAKTWKRTDKVVWTSIILAAILFGIGHLTIASAISDITPMVILRTVLLNGIGGVVFGWLFYRRGLEFAMISHFSADIVIHVLFPLLVHML